MTWYSQPTPNPFDSESAEHVFSDLTASGQLPMSDLADEDGATALLKAMFGNSPYLGQTALQDPAFLHALLAEGPDRMAQTTFNDLESKLPLLTSRDAFMHHLRRAKNRIALLTAAADIAGAWDLEKVTGTLSHFAELALDLSVAHLMRERMIEGEIAAPQGFDRDNPPPATPELARGAGFFILGMGKLGGYELNYSSDIDLIVLYDADIVQYTGRRHVQDCFVKMTRALVHIMQERTGDGYVFRTDLRLRPDPGATAIALSAEAAEVYYQSIGLNWERAAMIKARPVAGDLAAGEEFLARIKGFIWRKNLDYAALEDIHAIKKQIHRHHHHGDIAVAGHDVKLGIGGIREIEFFAQIHQLILGGRERELRQRGTVATLKTLAELGRIDEKTADELTDSYHYLRKLEHRLQMIRDEQTHMMPQETREVAHVAMFMGYGDTKSFEAELIAHLKLVHGHYEDLLSDSTGGGEEAAEPELSTNVSEAEAQLRALGFVAAAKAHDIIQSWNLGRYRACRTPRARTLLATLTPKILQALGETADPDAALIKFDEFLRNLPSGVQLFSLFQAHPWLLEVLAEIMGLAPALAEILGHRPQLLDAVLSPDFFAPLPAAADLRAMLEDELKAARDFQDVMDISRRWVNERKFQIGVQLLRGLADADAYTKANSDLADAVLQCLHSAVGQEFATRHGEVPGGAMVVLGMGKLGGRELTFTSDIDLIFIYEHPASATASTGPKSLAASHYYARLGQSFINALTAMTGEGRLYEVDMRLRPSGTAGPLALSLEAFHHYQHSDAWTWEHLALTRARVCAGPGDLAAKVEAEVKAVLTAKREPEKLLTDAADMRNRLRKEFGSGNIWSVKHVTGGLVDVEFICQYLQLLHAHDQPELLSTNTRDALARLTQVGILPADEGRSLDAAVALMNNVQALLRLCVGESFDEEKAPKDLKATLCAITGEADFAAVKRHLGAAQETVITLYRKYIEIPASQHITGDKDAASR